MEGDLGKLLALALVVATIASGQTDMSHFEVASVKLNKDTIGTATSCTGGPGTQSPTLWTCKQINTVNLLYSAFTLYLYQYSAPEWMRGSGSYWSVSARLPAGATRDQFREMQRNLLIERFGLIWRWRESDATVCHLVRDPGGVKLRESAPDAAPAVVEWGVPPGTTLGKDRYPVLPEGVPGLVGMGNHCRWRSSNVTMEDIAAVLQREFQTDIVDETGLTGDYDVDLRWETPPMEIFPSMPPYDGPDAKTEFRNRLGLRVESMKGKIRIFVVDHIDRVPTEN
jgi:uncharacterized protein (TIGR03435 family)